MHIQKITIRNILGIEDLEFSPAGFTTIEGPNGAGKSSVLEAIKAAVQPGHDATLLRNGAENGEIVFVLDDGMTVTKKVGADSSSTEVRGVDGKKVGRPAESLRGMLDMMSVNPVAFLTAEKKDRVKVLLESMPLEVDTAALTKLSGIKVTAQPGVHALHVIEQVSKQIFDDRTGTNRAVKEKDATIKQLNEAMPDAVDGVTGSEDEVVAQIDAAGAARDTTLGKIAAKIEGIKAQSQSDIDVIRTNLQVQIDDLKALAMLRVDDVKAALADNENKAAIAREAANAKYSAATAPLRAALAAMKADRSNAARRAQALDTVTTMTTELATLRADAERQTTALAAINKYKANLLKKLPIDGLEVRDGEIFVSGVALDRVNTAGQVAVAVGIAKLRAGDLGIVCLDRVEALDTAAFTELQEQIAEAGLQCFVTRVSDDEFAISTQD